MTKRHAQGRRQPHIRAAHASGADRIAQINVDSWNFGFCDFFAARQLSTELVRRWERDLAEPIPHR